MLSFIEANCKQAKDKDSKVKNAGNVYFSYAVKNKLHENPCKSC